MDYLKKFNQMLDAKGVSAHTKKSYNTYISTFLTYVNSIDKYMSEIKDKDLQNYIVWLKASRNLSDRTINAAISQLKFFWEMVLRKPWNPYVVPFRKFNEYLPFVPTKEEAIKFITSMPDLKQQAMVVLMYSSGLRICEVCNLRYEDISRKNMTIHIAHSKNRSDRYALLSKNALDILTQYWFTYGKPTGYLFPKQRDQTKPIDTNFIRRHIEAHEKRLGWPKRFTCHTFRHAYGTHLYQAGVDLLTIKTLMGHKSLSSTVIYVHLAVGKTMNVVSPFDSLEGI